MNSGALGSLKTLDVHEADDLMGWLLPKDEMLRIADSLEKKQNST